MRASHKGLIGLHTLVRGHCTRAGAGGRLESVLEEEQHGPFGEFV